MSTHTQRTSSDNEDRDQRDASISQGTSKVDIKAPGACYTEWIKSESKKQVLHINTYMWNLEKWYWWYLQGRNRDTDIEKGLVHRGEKRESEMNWDSSTDMYTLPVTHITTTDRHTLPLTHIHYHRHTHTHPQTDIHYHRQTYTAIDTHTLPLTHTHYHGYTYTNIDILTLPRVKFDTWLLCLFYKNQRSNCQHLLDHRKSKRIPKQHLLLLHWLC